MSGKYGNPNANGDPPGDDLPEIDLPDVELPEIELPPPPAPKPGYRPSGAPEIPEVLRSPPKDPRVESARRRVRMLPTMRTATTIEMRAVAIAVELIATTGAGVLVGFAIDHFAGTGTRWTLIIGIVGFAVGIYQTIRDGLKLNRQLEAQERGRFARRDLSEDSSEDRAEDEPDRDDGAPWADRNPS